VLVSGGVPGCELVLGVLCLNGVDQVQSVVNDVRCPNDRDLAIGAAFLGVRYLYVRTRHMSAANENKIHN